MANAFQALLESKPEALASGTEPTRPIMHFGGAKDAAAMIGEQKGMIVFIPAPTGEELPLSKSGKQVILGATVSGWGDAVKVGPLNTQVSVRWTMGKK